MGRFSTRMLKKCQLVGVHGVQTCGGGVGCSHHARERANPALGTESHRAVIGDGATILEMARRLRDGHLEVLLVRLRGEPSAFYPERDQVFLFQFCRRVREWVQHILLDNVFHARRRDHHPTRPEHRRRVDIGERLLGERADVSLLGLHPHQVTRAPPLVGERELHGDQLLQPERLPRDGAAHDAVGLLQHHRRLRRRRRHPEVHVRRVHSLVGDEHPPIRAHRHGAPRGEGAARAQVRLRQPLLLRQELVDARLLRRRRLGVRARLFPPPDVLGRRRRLRLEPCRLPFQPPLLRLGGLLLLRHLRGACRRERL
mmetsp:Transcript_42589/g.103397  ORF Transcript_42589/g.103397 Transcript_42589/m.103397 type:complete len:314 (-) Transcript_42589:176-1117(-)